jgi:CBS domain-containing protein
MTQAPPISDDLGSTPISKFMTQKVITAKEGASILKAMELMIENKISGLPVVDNTERLVGVYSEMDAILQAASKPLSTQIQCPNPKLITCFPDTSFREALVLMVKNRLKRLPIVNTQRQVVGILTRYDFMRAYVNDHKKPQLPKKPSTTPSTRQTPSKKK